MRDPCKNQGIRSGERSNGTYFSTVGRIRTGFSDWRSSGLVASGEKHRLADWGSGKAAPADFSPDEAGRAGSRSSAGVFNSRNICGSGCPGFMGGRADPSAGALPGYVRHVRPASGGPVTGSGKVRVFLEQGDTEGARQAVSMIVGRDTKRLTEEGIAKAAVETVAENASDGVIAPLLWMLVLGPLGGFFYKAVNTMDSMVGYKNERYLYFGRAAAYTDDAVNWIPARQTALFFILAAWMLPGMNGKEAWRIWRRDRRCHKSPNSAQPEAACAGALGVQLAGDAWYFGVLHKKPVIGDGKRPVEAEDIRRASRLMYTASAAALAAGTAAAVFLAVL